jgi:hypothetical protein
MLFEAITALFNSRVVNPYADLVEADKLRQEFAGAVQRQAIIIENLIGVDTDFEKVATSLVSLVENTKDALVSLPPAQETAVKEALYAIIDADTEQKEQALESFFNLLIESVQANIAYQDLLNLYLKPVETV